MNSDISVLVSVFESLEQVGIACDRENPLTLGNVCPWVFPAQQADTALVIKVGLSERAAQEVRMNQKGYENLKLIGASLLIPEPLQFVELHGVPIIIMGNCGEDFYHTVHRAPKPLKFYEYLTNHMEHVYHATLTTAISALPGLETLRERLIRQYVVHLGGLADLALIEKLRSVSLAPFAPPMVCFSTFDFTPEDVFVTARSVKYVDPLPENLGVPIFDLACFAGVARDAHNLPGSIEGYETLEHYACKELPSLLNLSPQAASSIFAFGRALQMSLSARFRIKTEPEKAKQFAKQSMDFLREVLEFLM